MVEVETPKERRARYLRLATKAREMAASAPRGAIREHYLRLEIGWTALADAVKSVRPKEPTK
jgi:hypothetical protein